MVCTNLKVIYYVMTDCDPGNLENNEQVGDLVRYG